MGTLKVNGNIEATESLIAGSKFGITKTASTKSDALDQDLVINYNLPANTSLVDSNSPGIGFHVGNTCWGQMIYNNNRFKFYNGADFSALASIEANAFIGNLNGNASSATALTTSAGNASQAIYFSAGKPVALDWHIGNSSVGERDCNNVTYNYCGYYTSNGPSTTLGASTVDGSLYSQAHSSSWVSQIAQDYRNGNLFIRGKSNGTWQPWKAVLTSVNYSSYCAPASHTHSYLPLSGGTLTGTLTMGASTGIQMVYRAGQDDVWIYPNGADTFGIRYYEGDPDKMTISASGNNNTITGADLCINGNGDGTVTIRGQTIIHTGNIGSQSVNYANSAGWATDSSSSRCLVSTGFGNTNFTYLQTPDSFYGNSGWTHYLMCNHGDGSSQYNVTIGLPFWGVPMYQRRTGTADAVSGWISFITGENIGSQSVNYASSAGNADTVGGKYFHWSGQSGQPNWLWGGNDGTNMYVYNPSNFNVDSSRYLRATVGNYNAGGLFYGNSNDNIDGSGSWSNWIQFGVSSDWHSKISIPYWGSPKYTRYYADSGSYSGWHDFITSENYTSYCMPNSPYISINNSDPNSYPVFSVSGRIDTGCFILTNNYWTGYGTAHPEDAGITKIVGRVYFRI